MSHKLTGIIILFALCLMKVNSQPVIEWEKSFGGSAHDEAYSIEQTSDGGYIAAGISKSIDGDVTAHLGDNDFWIVKFDDIGRLDWEKSFISTGMENAYSIQQTNDEGFIIAGSGYSDYLVIKTDGQGETEWYKYLGGSGSEAAYSIRQTIDGGYIVAGETSSSGGDITFNHGARDIWVVKLDPDGEIEWQKTYGGTVDEKANSIQLTADNGYIIAGQTLSSDGDVTDNSGVHDFWILKIDSVGDILWQNTYGGSSFEEALGIRELKDGGFIAVGYSASNDLDVSINNGKQDVWIIRLDNAGQLVWEKSFGGSKDEIGFSVDQTSDDGFIIGSASNSPNDGDVSGNHGQWDYWIIKLDPDGDLEWQQSYGGSNYDVGRSIQQTNDEGYVMAGYGSSTDGDIGHINGGRDYWIIKLAPLVGTSDIGYMTEMNIYPNPAGNYLNVEVSDSFENIEIINSIGCIVKQINGKESLVDVHDIANGLYFLRITIPGGLVTRKFSILH